MKKQADAALKPSPDRSPFRRTPTQPEFAQQMRKGVESAIQLSTADQLGGSLQAEFLLQAFCIAQRCESCRRYGRCG